MAKWGLTAEIAARLAENFPPELELLPQTHAKRARLPHLPITAANFGQCKRCGKWVTDCSQPALRVLPDARQFDGQLYCDSCGYDVRQELARPEERPSNRPQT